MMPYEASEEKVTVDQCSGSTVICLSLSTKPERSFETRLFESGRVMVEVEPLAVTTIFEVVDEAGVVG